MPRQLARYLFATITSALLFAATPTSALEAGDSTPEIELPGTGGTPIRITRQSGKVLYLDFWASWCGPCRQSFPWMNAMQEKYKAQGLQVIGINVDAQGDDAEKFLAKMPTKFTIAYDPKGNSARLFGVKGMPTSLLIGKDGKVISQHIGFNDESRDKMEQAIQAALGAQK